MFFKPGQPVINSQCAATSQKLTVFTVAIETVIGLNYRWIRRRPTFRRDPKEGLSRFDSNTVKGAYLSGVQRSTTEGKHRWKPLSKLVRLTGNS